MSGKKSKQKAQKEHKENTRACVSPSFSGQGRVRKYARGHYTIANANTPFGGLLSSVWASSGREG